MGKAKERSILRGTIVESQSRTIKLWTERLLGPRPGLKELNVLCWCFFAFGLVIPISIFFFSRHKFTDLPPIDFVYYYGDGRLVNEYPPEGLYDPGLQKKVFDEIYPPHGESWSISPYPPLVGRIFSYYARLPVFQAYWLWFGTSLLLYISGLAAVLAVAYPRDKLKISLMLCLALAFPPFLWFTLISGQLASVAVFSLGCAIYLERRSWGFLSGLALSILSYKPTLLVLVLPMLLLTRRFRGLMGFLAGVVALTGVATILSGTRAWVAYAGMIKVWLHGAGVRGKAIYKHSTLVDLNSMRHDLFGAGSTFGLIALVLIMALVVAWTVPLLWKSFRGDRSIQHLVWAVTLSWTLLLNLYVPIYDAVLVVIVMCLTLGLLLENDRRDLLGWGVSLGLCIFVVSFFTETFAEHYHVQLLTILLFIQGVYASVLLHSEIRRKHLTIEPSTALKGAPDRDAQPLEIQSIGPN